MKKCIMAIMAHADDLEVYAGGTMAKFVEQGYEGVLVQMTESAAGARVPGKGYRQTTREETKPLRDEELRRGAEILGVRNVERLDFQSMLYSDGKDFVWIGDDDYNYRLPGAGPLMPAVAINPKLIAPVIDLITRYEPEIVIGQHMLSGFEHVCTGHILNQAFRQAMEKGVSLGQLWTPSCVRHCTWASDVRLYPSPNVLIDITSTWEKKVAAMLAHESQGLDKSVEKIRVIAQYWGLARQCELAEAFFTLCDARYR